MPGGGTRTFLEPKRYEASLRAAQLDAVLVSRGKFRARLTWAELHHFQVLHCEEDLPHAAYVHLAPQLVFVTFPSRTGPLAVWRGTELQADEIIFHSRGERLHHLTRGPFVWSVVAVDAAQLGYHGQVLARTPLVAPPEGRMLWPSPSEAARLQRLHAQACRLAETKAKILSHPEVARAIEQAVSGPRGGAANRGPMGGAAVGGPYGGAAARRPYGGAAVRGPYGGTAIRGPIYGGAVYRPGVGYGVAAGVAVGAAAGAAAASTYYPPYCSSPPYCHPAPYYLSAARMVEAASPARGGAPEDRLVAKSAPNSKEQSRRVYRQLLFTAPDATQSAVPFYKMRQSAGRAPSPQRSPIRFRIRGLCEESG